MRNWRKLQCSQKAEAVWGEEKEKSATKTDTFQLQAFISVTVQSTQDPK